MEEKRFLPFFVYFDYKLIDCVLRKETDTETLLSSRKQFFISNFPRRVSFFFHFAGAGKELAA